MPNDPFSSFRPRTEWLVCVDSDGCAMNTMDAKHKQAFCPQLLRVYGLEAYAGLITPYWMQLNLYSCTRGINRFKGLAATLLMLQDEGVAVPGAQAYCAWVKTSPTLSNAALQEKIAAGGGIGFERALEWSVAVNQAIERMGGSARPFRGVREALAILHAKADVVVVSSANGEAITTEWTRHGLAAHTDLLLGQDAGTKEACIKALIQKGYKPGHVLMIGDALGDRNAAQGAGALFYPILVGRERQSWQTLIAEAFPRFLASRYAGAYEGAQAALQSAILK